MNTKARQAYEAAGADLSEALTIDELSEGDNVLHSTGSGVDEFEVVTVEGFEQMGYADRVVLSNGSKLSEMEMWDPEDSEIQRLTHVGEEQ